jgi:ubiquinone biosynthesis protein
MERHGLRPPRALLVLSRSLLTLEGTLKQLDPGFDLPTEAADLVVRERLGDVGEPQEVLRRELVRALPALRTLPEHAETLASQLRTGRLVVRAERYGGGDRPVVDAWLDRVLVAAAGGIGALTSATVLAAGSMANDRSVRDACWVLGFAGLTAATTLLLRTVAQSLHGQSVRGDWPAEPSRPHL